MSRSDTCHRGRLHHSASPFLQLIPCMWLWPRFDNMDIVTSMGLATTTVWPGNSSSIRELLEKQHLRFRPDLLKWNLPFNKIPRNSYAHWRLRHTGQEMQSHDLGWTWVLMWAELPTGLPHSLWNYYVRGRKTLFSYSYSYFKNHIFGVSLLLRLILAGSYALCLTLHLNPEILEGVSIFVPTPSG